jgi:hypothetical protein
LFSLAKLEVISNLILGHQVSHHPEKNDPRSIKTLKVNKNDWNCGNYGVSFYEAVMKKMVPRR